MMKPGGFPLDKVHHVRCLHVRERRFTFRDHLGQKAPRELQIVEYRRRGQSAFPLQVIPEFRLQLLDRRRRDRRVLHHDPLFGEQIPQTPQNRCISRSEVPTSGSIAQVAAQALWRDT